jgi:ABC-type Fe3+-hydroxamate transport system substrate-binding protein
MIRTVKDQLNRTIEIPFFPKRIISLVPSQTELLYDLGLEDAIVGITKFCVHPFHWRKTKTIVGGTKNCDIARIENLRPDLIIGNKEENDQLTIEQLQANYPVWMSDIITLEDALQMIQEIAEITNTSARGVALLNTIKRAFQAVPDFGGQSVLYLIWKNPWMAVGSETFINSMLNIIGLQNVITETRYPVLESDQLDELTPVLVFLSSEPYPFREKHIDEIKSVFPDADVKLIDGEMFSWYGSRLQKAPAYFSALTNQ